MAPERNQNLSEEEKQKKRDIAMFANNIKIFLKMKNKDQLVKYKKKYYKIWKNKTASQRLAEVFG